MPGLLETLEIRAGALRERLDARRRKEAEGQMGLDLSGSTKPAGGGEKCGQGWIDPNKTCRKGSGDAPYEARRSRPKETIVFPEPLVGPSGAKLRSYSWQWTLVEDVDARGEVVEKRVSDWEKSLANVETGRQVVHQFDVEVNGEIRTVSAESALKLMGYLSSGDAKPFTSLKSTARTVARLRMARAELDQLQERWEKEWQEVVAQPKPSASAGEWRQGNGDYKKRTWQMGDIKEEQIWNSNGKFTDQEMESSLVRQWHAERMRERGWDYKGERRGAMEAYVTRTRRDLERRLARAEAKLQARPTLDSLGKRLDGLSVRLGGLFSVGQPGDLDPLGFSPSPEVFATGRSGLRNLGSTRLAGQDHRIGKSTHGASKRQDQDSAGLTGKPCGQGFISQKYTCHAGRNNATTTSLEVEIEADEDRTYDIKKAIQFYTNSPNRIKYLQSQNAISDGLDISVYGYSQSEQLSKLGLDKVVRKELSRKIDLIENYIEKAPKYDGVVHRGVWFSSTQDAQDFIRSLTENYVATIDSWSASRDVAERFSGLMEPKSYQQAAVILRQKNVHGAPIKNLSTITEESEVLQPSGVKYRILSVTESRQRLYGEMYMTVHEVEVEAIEHKPYRRRDVLDSLEATLARLDARIKQAPGQLALSFGSSGSKGKGKGTGQPCGDGWIPRDKTCHKSGSQTGKQLHPLLQEALRRKAEQAKAAKAPKPPAAIGPVAVSLAPDGSVLINGKPPKKSLGGGAYGDAFMADGPDGPVVVKVDRVTNADPMESNPDVPREQQRRNMVERELNNMRKAHELGLASEPLGTVQQLPDGRLAFAYRMIEGVKKAKDHRMMNMTPEATELMAQPGALANYARSVAVIARKMADAGFSHGDMHAGNMILSSDGSLNLVDWGYAAMRRPGSAAAIASEEANTLFILGGGMINVNSMVDRKLTGRGPKPDIIYALNDTISRARDAESAYRRIKSEYTKKWREDPANDLENPGKAIREANRLTREEGIPYDEAERRVGLEPPISPEVEAAAARERDRIFGSDRLRRFRRAVDRHYAAWNEFDW